YAPAQVLRLGVEAAPVAIDGIAAEDRGNLERVGKLVGALAPAHRALDEARDVKSFVPDAGAVHLEQHDAGGISADRRPYRIAERVGGHRYVGYHRAQLGEALRRLAHARVDVGFRVGVAKTFLDHGDAQAVDDPPALKPRLRGLCTGPLALVWLPPETQKYSHTALPAISPPASRMRSTTVASTSGT